MIFFITRGSISPKVLLLATLRKWKLKCSFFIINLKSRSTLHKIDSRKLVWLVPIWICFSESEIKKFWVGTKDRGHKQFSVPWVHIGLKLLKLPLTYLGLPSSSNLGYRCCDSSSSSGYGTVFTTGELSDANSTKRTLWSYFWIVTWTPFLVCCSIQDWGFLKKVAWLLHRIREGKTENKVLFSGVVKENKEISKNFWPKAWARQGNES